MGASTKTEYRKVRVKVRFLLPLLPVAQIRPGKSFRQLEIYAFGVCNWKETSLGHSIEWNVQQICDLFFIWKMQGCPCRSQSPFTEGEHKAPHCGEDRTPCACLAECWYSTIKSPLALNARNHHDWYLVEDFSQVA